MKCHVETELKLDNGTQKKYVGRFLGFVTDAEYKQLIGNAEITSRIETKPTKDFMKCCTKANENNWGLNGVRFVLVVRKIDGVNVLKKLLVVSDKLNYEAETKPDKKEVMFVTTKGEYISVREKEANTE